MIVTFFSFKGGVGRSMALANVAWLFASDGKRVTAVDWDLEAPGLEKYLAKTHRDVDARRGILDLIQKYKEDVERHTEAVKEHNALSDDEKTKGITIPTLSLDLQDYVISDLHDRGKLSLIPAGRRSSPEEKKKYNFAIKTLDLHALYKKYDGELFFDDLRRSLNELVGEDGIVLIDSRTGLSESAGVCTLQLADIVVLMSAANEQNIGGVEAMASQLKESIKYRNDPLELLIVPSRVEDRAETQKLERFAQAFRSRFNDYVPECLKVKGSESSSAFWNLKIPHVPYFAFEEELAVDGRLDPVYSEDLATAYRRLKYAIATVADDLKKKAEQANSQEPSHPEPERKAARRDVAIVSASAEAEKELRNEIVQFLKDRKIDAFANTKTDASDKESIKGAVRDAKRVVPLLSRAFGLEALWTTLEAHQVQHQYVLSVYQPVVPVVIDDTLKSADRESAFFRTCRNGYLDFNRLAKGERAFRLFQLYRSLSEPEYLRADLSTHVHTIAPRSTSELASDVAQIYRLRGYHVYFDRAADAFTLRVQDTHAGAEQRLAIECLESVVTLQDARDMVASRQKDSFRFNNWSVTIVTSKRFELQAYQCLSNNGIGCLSYRELLDDIVPLELYCARLISTDPSSIAAGDVNHRTWFPAGKEQFEEIGKWLADDAENLFLLFGDLGTGKTALIRYLAGEMAKAYQMDRLRQPAPVFISLRDVRGEESLEQIVLRHFRESGFLLGSFAHFQELLLNGQIVLFLDGFDEFADRQDRREMANSFRELTRLATRSGKVVVTMRSQLFRSKGEVNHLLGRQVPSAKARQDGLPPNATLQVMTEQETEEFTKTGGDDDWNVCHLWYDLSDVMRRPAFNKIIRAMLPGDAGGSYQQRRAELDVSAVYQSLVAEILEQEHVRGRRAVDPESKMALLGDIAWEMHDLGKQEFSSDEMEACVRKYYAEMRSDATPSATDYAQEITRDLLVGSFLGPKDSGIPGPDQSDADQSDADQPYAFHFPHESLREFLIAKRLEMVSESVPELKKYLRTDLFAMNVIYFLSFYGCDSSLLLRSLRTILSHPYEKGVSEQAFYLLLWMGQFIRVRAVGGSREDPTSTVNALRHHTAGDTEPSGWLDEKWFPRAMNLQGADLTDWTIAGATLRDADFTDANMSRTTIRKSNLEHCKLDGADMTGSVHDHVWGKDVSFKSVRFENAVFQHVGYSSVDFTGTHLSPAQYEIASKLKDVKGLLNVRPVVDTDWPRVEAIAFHPQDPEILAVAGRGLVRLVGVHKGGNGEDDGGCTRTMNGAFFGHTASVTHIVFAADGREMFVGCSNGEIRRWDVVTGKEVKCFPCDEADLCGMAVSRSGHRIVKLSGKDNVRVLDGSSGDEVSKFEVTCSRVTALAIDALGRRVAVGCSDGNIRLFDGISGKPQSTLCGHGGAPTSLRFDNGDKELFAIAGDGTHRWDLETAQHKSQPLGSSGIESSVCFRTDCVRVALAGGDGKIVIHDRVDRTPLPTDLTVTVRQRHSQIEQTAINCDGNLLAVRTSDGAVEMWDIARPQEAECIETISAAESKFIGITCVAGTRTLATSKQGDRVVHLWRAEDAGNGAKGLRYTWTKEHDSEVTCLTNAGKGSIVSGTGSDRGEVKIWEISDGNGKERPAVPLNRRIAGLTVKEDQIVAVLASGRGDSGEVVVCKYTAEIGKPEKKRTTRTVRGQVAFDRQSDHIAFADKTLTISVPTLDDVVVHTPDFRVATATFSPDGKSIAIGASDGRIQIRNVDELVNQTPPGVGHPTSLDDSILKASADDGHVASVTSLVYLDDKTLLSGSTDNRVVVWDIDGRRARHGFDARVGQISLITVSPNGRFLICGGTSGRIRIWDWETRECVISLFAFAMADSKTERDWLAVLPDNRFDGSQRGVEKLMFLNADAGSLDDLRIAVQSDSLRDPVAVRDVLSNVLAHDP